MSYSFTDPVHYYITWENKPSDIITDFNKIIDYLLTFTGEVGIQKKSDSKALISYEGVDFKAILKTNIDKDKNDILLPQQITLTCEKEDNLSVNLIKNITHRIGYRIYNPQINSYLVMDPNILDLTTTYVKPSILKIINYYGLTPFFQYRDAMVYYASDSSGKIHLINRHLLEYLVKNPDVYSTKKQFSVVIAEDIGRFIALFDRGLIPISFYKYTQNEKNILNLSGFNLDRAPFDFVVDPIFFEIDLEKQVFNQLGSASINQRIIVKKGQSTINKLKKLLKSRDQKYLNLKFAHDISFIKDEYTLTPKLSVSIYLDN